VHEIIPKIEKGGGADITAANTLYELHPVTSGRKFKLETLIVTNPISGAEARFYVYDGVSGSTTKRLDLIIRASDTIVLGKDELKGVPDFISGVVVASTVSGLWAHAGGYEY